MKSLRLAFACALAVLGIPPASVLAQECVNVGAKSMYATGVAGSSVTASASYSYGFVSCLTRVEVWVDGASNKSCVSGSMEGGACVDTAGSWGNSVSAAQITNENTYGSWTGQAKFWLIRTSDGGWVDNGSRSDTINLGNPPGDEEPCEPHVRNDILGQPAGRHANLFSSRGRSAAFRLGAASGLLRKRDGGYCEEPIVVPTGNGNNFKFTSRAKGVMFDINADGLLDLVAWTEADSDVAFLAIDRNGNGRIDDGKELFGNHTVDGAPNGFAALDKIEPNNGDGFIDGADSLYAKLLLWTDRNHNGQTESGELAPFSSLYTKIGLGFTLHNRRDGQGNLFRFRGWAEQGSRARVRPIYDIFLRTRG